MFWPLFFPIVPLYYGSQIYGPANNSSRPGGELQSYTLLPTWTTPLAATGVQGPANNTFGLYGDQQSLNDIVPILVGTCNVAYTYGQNFTPSPFNAVEYYRESSFVLTLDNYNNSVPDISVQDASQSFTPSEQEPAPLPAAVNLTYFNCLNATIGSYLGLVDSDYATDAASSRYGASSAAGFAALATVAINLFM